MNEKDYRVLFEGSFRGLYGYTLKFIADEAVCEEIVMDVMLRVWQKKELLQSPLSLSSYLYKAVRNGVIDHLRKNRKRMESLGNDAAGKHSPYAADGVVLYKELECRYRMGLERLSPRKKLIFSMSRSGESYQQIAYKLGVSKNTVENHMTAALRVMRAFVYRDALN